MKREIVNPGTKYYIISAKHTNAKDEFITLWRPDNAGYCYAKEHAGVYNGYEKGYHDTDIVVEADKLEPLFIKVEDMGVHRLPNHNSVWKQLGYKLHKGKLQPLTHIPSKTA